ncbi:DNA primase [Sphingomonas turrisvirgatae]|uniref:DNA primase n=1 Tax=Sphingomonas turrisvirgatae TaxID=1888892 RepID=A0A1E3M0Z6_9SPHN|nr:DNA primase [Sphingomonas turrisvirgatae]ODP39659.1 DNA primase [Sphingomonas turrisvirgatae]
MGGYQVTGRGPGDDGYDEDGYDESQRAEILEATRDGPSDGTILTDLNPDLGEDPDAMDEDDELAMTADEVADETIAETDEADDDEDDLQADFDDDAVEEDALDDGDEVALNP